MRALVVLALVVAVASATPLQRGPADLALRQELKALGISEETLNVLATGNKEVLKQLRKLETTAREVAIAQPRLMEDAMLTTPELITKYGYPSESHEIVTSDGYILTYHRIPYGKDSTTKTPNPRPLILMHGLMCSSDDWIVTGPGKGLGYVLADAGFDVWIGNSRGNKWSRRHTTIDPDTKDFWTFSWHEMGVYDLPAAIDYILANTTKKSVDYVGHSMGTAMFTVMAAKKTSYNKKIRAAVLMAPTIFYAHKEGGQLVTVAKYAREIDLLLSYLGIHELMTHHDIYTELGDTYCKDGDLTQGMCVAAAEMAGVNPEQFNKTILPVFLAHFPSGAATKNYIHFLQGMGTGEFRQYDHGSVMNMIHYGHATPPMYNLAKVTAPVAVHYAENDGNIDPADAELFANSIPNLIELTKVPNEKFNHMDFLIAMQAKELVYDKLISQLQKY